MKKEDIGHIQKIYAGADCLFSGKQVRAALDRLGEELTQAYADSDPLLLCVMTGGMIACGQLATRLDFPLQIDYIHATRYRGDTSGSELHWLVSPHISLHDRTVIVVDDILDEGITLKAISEWCREQGAARVVTVVLVEKLHDRRYGLEHADHVGLQVGDRYVFGYGLDYHGYLRNVDGIYAVKEE